MSDFQPVKLRSPEGDLFTAQSAVELNDLVFGHGYTVVGKRDISDVLPASDPAAKPTTVDKAATADKATTKENAGG
jgi:hypothetical protein